MLKKITQFLKTQNQPKVATIKPSGQTIEIPGRQTLLKAAIGQGLAFPHHCTVGTCGNCRCKLLKGDIKEVRDFSYTLSNSEIKDGYILACQTVLKSDIEIELDFDEAAVAASSYQAKITHTLKLTHDIIEITVQLDNPIQFVAGQYADIKLPGFDRPRSYSFAMPPALDGSNTLKFYIRLVPGGAYTEWLFAEDRCGEKFELLAPFGNFRLRASEAPIICIAGGSGMAPIKAILEDALKQNIKRPITFLFGAREQKDLYCLDEMQALKDQWPVHFDFCPILSEEPEDSDWQGKRGLVTEFINADAAGLTGLTRIAISDCHAYLCGPPGMIDAALLALEAANVDTDNIHYDKFLDARQLDS